MLSLSADLQYVKGVGPRRAEGLREKGLVTVEDLLLIRKAVGSQCRIKASGGIKDLATLTTLVEAGAERIGTSAGAAVV